MDGPCERAGVKPFGFHGIGRHAASVSTGDQNFPKMETKELLRRENLSTTEKYLENIHHKASDMMAAIR